MSTKIKQEFLDSVPVTKVKEYKECLSKRGPTTDKCKPIKSEFEKFKKAAKAEVASKTKAVSKDKSVSKAKPMTVAEKCKRTPITKCKTPCKVFKTPNGKYCRKLKPGAKKSSKQEKKTLSTMA